MDDRGDHGKRCRRVRGVRRSRLAHQYAPPVQAGPARQPGGVSVRRDGHDDESTRVRPRVTHELLFDGDSAKHRGGSVQLLVACVSRCKLSANAARTTSAASVRRRPSPGLSTPSWSQIGRIACPRSSRNHRGLSTAARRATLTSGEGSAAGRLSTHHGRQRLLRTTLRIEAGAGAVAAGIAGTRGSATTSVLESQNPPRLGAVLVSYSAGHRDA